jgi:hypothetical protein
MKRHKANSRQESKQITKGNHRSGPVPLAKLSKRSAQARTNALHVLSEVRRNPKLRLSAAARSLGVKPSVVKKYFGSSLEKVDGHWRVSKSDRFRETMYVPDVRGNPVPVHTRSSKERTQVSAYLRDIGRFFRGSKSAMAKWHGKRIAGVELVTASRTLIGIESQLSDFSIYNAFNGGAE